MNLSGVADVQSSDMYSSLHYFVDCGGISSTVSLHTHFPNQFLLR